MFCDFCSETKPCWRFEAQPFATVCGNLVATSDSGWAACDACCSLIVSGDRAGLLERGTSIDSRVSRSCGSGCRSRIRRSSIINGQARRHASRQRRSAKAECVGPQLNH